jgi:hypothetical protein
MKKKTSKSFLQTEVKDRSDSVYHSMVDDGNQLATDQTSDPYVNADTQLLITPETPKSQ